MSTWSSASKFGHTSSAKFRAWALELHTGLLAAGWERTADTGQINWSSPPSIPSVGVSAGYEIFRMNDSLRDTAPIFIKLEYGTHWDNAATPDMWFTIGTGTDGAGVISGTLYVRTSIQDAFPNSRPINSTTTNYLSFACATEGCMWFVFKALARSGSNNRGFFAFAVMRTVDDGGDVTPDGIVVYRDSGDANGVYSAHAVSVNRTTGLSWSRPDDGRYGAGYTFNPYGMTGTIYGGSPPQLQVTRHFCVMPDARPLEHILSTPESSSIPLGTSFDAAVLSGPHTWMCVGNAFSACEFICLPWE